MSETVNVSQEWSAVAAAWDRHVDTVDEHSAAATAALLAHLAVRPGERVLELAAGPGSLGTDWSRLVGESGTVVLSDIAPGMVEAARRRTEGLGNVTVAILDASAIDVPDGSFDVVACRMGLMFTADPAAALADISRVLRPGGRIGVLTWGPMEHNPWMTCVGMAAMVNGVVAGGPPVGPGGIFSLADVSELDRLVEAAGFSDVVVEEHDVVFRADSIEDHVERVGSLAGPLAVALQRAAPEQIAAVRRTAAELASKYVTDTGLELPGRALLAAGRR